jgi:hypothetical protein
MKAVFPYITVEETPFKETQSLSGKSGLAGIPMQISCYDPNHDTAWALREAVKNYLLNYRGAAGDRDIQTIMHRSDRHLYITERALHQCITTLVVWFET